MTSKQANDNDLENKDVNNCTYVVRGKDLVCIRETSQDDNTLKLLTISFLIKMLKLPFCPQ